MATQLTIKLHGEGVPLRSLGDALSAVSILLTELDHIVSDGRTVEWSLSGLTFGSAEVVATPRPLTEATPDYSGEILHLLEAGLLTLETSSNRPDRYTDKALQIAKTVASVSKGIERLSFRIRVNSLPDSVFDITQRVGVAVDEILSRKNRAYGSVEGVVEIIDGVQDYFEIVDTLANRRIRCHVDKSKLEEISRLYFEKRLIVSGEITEDRFGHPKGVKVERYRPLMAKENLPRPRDLLGLYVGLPNG